MGIGSIIKEAREKAGLSQAQLGEYFGISGQAVSEWERDQGIPKGQRLLKLSKKLGIPPAKLLIEVEHSDWPTDSALERLMELPGVTVPLVGYIGAGAQAHYYAVAQSELDDVPAPSGATPSTVAVEIRGTSLGKVFSRWLAFYDHVQRPLTDELLDQLCVVWLANDQVLIKTPFRNPKTGKIELRSEHEPPIVDADIEGAALVTHLSRRR